MLAGFSKKSAGGLIFLWLATLSGNVHAQEGKILPMHKYPLGPGVNTLGNIVYPGVEVSISETSNALGIRPTGDLFFVPSLTSVKGLNRVTYESANCEAVNAELDNELILTRSASPLIKLLDKNKEEIASLVQLNADKSAKCAADQAQLDELKSNLEALAADETSAKEDLTAAKAEYDECNLLHSEDQCETSKAELLAVNGVHKNLKARKSSLKAQIQEIRERSNCRDALEAEQKVSTLITKVNDYIAKINAIKDISNGTLETMAKTSGGTASAIVSSRATQQQQELAEANPGYRIRPIEIEKAVFSLVPDIADTDTQILRRTVLGVGIAGQGAVPSGEGADTLPAAVAGTVVQAQGDVALHLSLSRLGACSSRLTRSGGFVYQYSSYSTVRGLVKWNRWTTYKFIQKTTKRGGLFSSKTVSKIKEQLDNKDEFVFMVDEYDGKNSEVMKEELKKAFLEQILSKWTDVATVTPSGEATTLPEHGATTIANGLKDLDPEKKNESGKVTPACQQIYCAVGSFVLKGLNAIFGKDTNEVNVEKDHNNEYREEFSYTTTYTKYASSAALIEWN